MLLHGLKKVFILFISEFILSNGIGFGKIFSLLLLSFFIFLIFEFMLLELTDLSLLFPDDILFSLWLFALGFDLLLE